MWNIFFNKKEKKMPTTETGATKALKNTVSRQKATIVALQKRLGALTDDIHMLQRDLSKFKKNVAADINELFDRVGAD
tara:strand:- start:968 stop:1201 length:234 start_codon:yes stop_codon:yes gene_type:complete